MAKNYYLVIDCHSYEDHDGLEEITKEEFDQLVNDCKQRQIKTKCTDCNLIVEDENGNEVFNCCVEKRKSKEEAQEV